MIHAARAYLQANNETLDDWKGVCGCLVDAIAEPGDSIIYMEGDIPWDWHMILLRDGLIHDPWCEGDPLPLKAYLEKMFGLGAWVDILLDGEPFYTGEVKDFNGP